MLTLRTNSTLLRLTNLTLIKVLHQHSILILQVRNFMSIVNIIQIFQAEQILFKTIVDSRSEKLIYEFAITNGIIHEMKLPFQYQKIIQLFILLNNIIIKFDFNNSLIEVRLYLFIRPLTNIVPFQIELLNSFVRYLNSLICNMIVTKPFSCIVAVIHIDSQNIETLTQRLLTLEAVRLIVRHFRFLVKRKNLTLILEFFIIEELRVFEVSRTLTNQL